MSSPSYYELLKHPKWQKKRLEVMENARFTCEYCGAEDKTLNVHHGYYEKGLKPWEYPDNTLSCLCEPCHAHVTALTLAIHRKIGRLDTTALLRLYGYVQALTDDYFDANTMVVDSFETAQGAGDAYHLHPKDVIDEATNHDGEDEHIHGYVSQFRLDAIAHDKAFARYKEDLNHGPLQKN